ncbi:MAG: RNA polymerase sigma factor [Ignavibacteriaceae bacterium]
MEQNSKQIEATLKQERNKLFGFIRKNVPTKEDAEDILQEVFYQFVSGYEEIEFIERISAWLIRVAKNKIIDQYRKKKTERLSDQKIKSSDDENDEPITLSEILPDLSRLPDEIYWQNIISEEIEDALDEMPEEQKDVFIMNEYDGLTFKEISNLKNVFVNTLLSRKRYAILFLRKKLKNLYEELE